MPLSKPPAVLAFAALLTFRGCNAILHTGDSGWCGCAGSTPAAGQQHASASPQQTLVLPDVPNVWDEMDTAAEANVAVPEEVQYMERDGANNLANDAMLLIMHAVQARSQGRSLTEERRASTEHFWRQAEERDEAQLFRSSRDGSDGPGSQT